MIDADRPTAGHAAAMFGGLLGMLAIGVLVISMSPGGGHQAAVDATSSTALTPFDRLTSAPIAAILQDREPTSTGRGLVTTVAHEPSSRRDTSNGSGERELAARRALLALDTHVGAGLEVASHEPAPDDVVHVLADPQLDMEFADVEVAGGIDVVDGTVVLDSDDRLIGVFADVDQRGGADFIPADELLAAASAAAPD